MLLAMNAVDKAAKSRAIAILVAGSVATLVAARVVGVAIWRLLDPGALG